MNYLINYILFFFIIIIISCKEKIEKNKNQVLPTLVTLENEEFKLEELKGNVVILNLWATWCKPCIAEFKNLEGPNVKFYYINDYHNIFADDIDSYKKLFFIGDIHWNKKGNFLVANEIINKLNF